MTRELIPTEEFTTRIHHLWDVQSLLLTSGDYAQCRFNAMTIGWGSIGYIWRRPFIQILVRHTRYTYQFMESFDTFTVCAFPDNCHAALKLLGTKSGRDGDKIAESGLTPAASTMIAAPGYVEASLVLECRKIYWDDIDPQHFLTPEIDKHYPARDYHRIYFGEILAAYGEGIFKA